MTTNQNSIENEINIDILFKRIQAFISKIISNWKLLVLFVFVGISLGVVYSLISKPLYTAKLTFAVDENEESGLLSSYSGIANQLGLNLGSVNNGLLTENNIIEVMQSNRIISEAFLSPIKKYNSQIPLINYFIEFNHYKIENQEGFAKNDQNLFTINANIDSLTRFQDSLLNCFTKSVLKNDLEITESDKKSNIICVSFRSKDEFFAKDFVKAIVDQTVKFYTLIKTKKALENLQVIKVRLDSVRSAYYSSLYKTANSIDKNLDPSFALTEVPKMQNQTNTQILATEYAELIKNYEISRLMLMQQRPVIQIIDKPHFPLEKAKFSLIKGALLGFLLGNLLAVIILAFKH